MHTVDKRRGKWIRRVIQIVFFLFIFAIVFSHYIERKGLNLPWGVLNNFHAICPFGAVETAGRLILDGRFIPKIHESNIWVFSGVMLGTLLFGSVFCGYLCPLGSVQEWIGLLGKRIFKKKYNRFIGEKLDRALGYLRYGVLILILLKTTQAVSLVFQRVDPYYALFHFWMGDVFFTALIVLGAVLLLSLFFERPWCRWFCPFGALLGLVQLLSPWKIRCSERICSSCGGCSNACPMHIPVHKRPSVIDTRCNRCGSCIDACRREGAITYSLPGKSFVLKKKLAIGVLAIALFSAPILFAHTGGLFKTSNRPAGRRGQLVLQDIKGSMTLKEIARGLSMDMETLASILGIPTEIPDSTRVYDLEDIDEYLTMKNVKGKLSEYLGSS